MRKKLDFQYFYRVNGCPAVDAVDARCICWHAEGEGPREDERHDDETPVVDWRIKPDNAE